MSFFINHHFNWTHLFAACLSTTQKKAIRCPKLQVTHLLHNFTKINTQIEFYYQTYLRFKD